MKKPSQLTEELVVKTIFLLTLLSTLTLNSFAATGSIIQVTRRLRMSALEAQSPKNYFIDLGERNGLKSGDVVEVYRMIPVMNQLTGGAWHLMKVTLGEIKIYMVGESTAVGHLESDRDLSTIPVQDYPNFMLGDQVEMKTAMAPLPKTSEKSSLPFQ